MKKAILLTLILIILCACSTSENTIVNLDETKSIGIITRIDPTLCDCCGGFFITIDEVEYRFYPTLLPENDLNLPFANDLPLTVLLDWESDAQNQPEYCSDIIKILSIERN